MQWLAVVVGALPLYALAIYAGVLSQNSPAEQLPSALITLATTLAEVLFFCGLMTACLYYLNGQRLAELNLQAGSLLLDLGRGTVLFGQLFASVILLGLVVRALGGDTIPDTNVAIGKQLAGDPWLAAVFLGPVLWLKAALLEEFSRVFMLSRLWQAHPGQTARWVILLGVSILFGLGHLWQGWYGVAGTTVIGLVLGWHYMRYGRVLPLIIAHGVYNTIVTLILIAIGSGSIPFPGE